MTPSEKREQQASMFANRLAKRAQHFRKWAKKQGITAYRIYDRDIPEIPLCVDHYGFTGGRCTDAPYAVVSLFERPYEKNPDEEDLWIDAMSRQIEATLAIPADHVILKLRRRQKGNAQYEKADRRTRAISGIFDEGKLRFGVNLSDYLDTGLFLDHRPLRRHLSENSKDKRVLNLFAYTGSLSCAAAVGGASFVQTVDLSNTYLGWASDNLRLNAITDTKSTPLVRMDVVEFLEIQVRKQKAGNAAPFDTILLDPPTFSNSKKTADVLDINRQWPQLVRDCLSLLRPGGTLYFSTNSRRLSFSSDDLPPTISGRPYDIKDITDITIPEDFKAHRIHRCWKFTMGN